jgi:hypothetical protein
MKLCESVSQNVTLRYTNVPNVPKQSALRSRRTHRPLEDSARLLDDPSDVIHVGKPQASIKNEVGVAAGADDFVITVFDETRARRPTVLLDCGVPCDLGLDRQ